MSFAIRIKQKVATIEVGFNEKKINSNFYYNFSSLAKGDFNNDNKVDFLVGFEQTVGLTLITNTGNNSNLSFDFKRLPESYGVSIDLLVTDFDLDGDDDILHLYDYEGFSIYLNGIISNTKDEFLDDNSIFPNPVSSILQINSSNPCSIHSVKIYDYLGICQQVVYQPCDTKINVEHLAKGAYFIELIEGQIKKVTRFIKI